MCGFFGVAGNIQNVDKENFEKSASLIRHRGPDQFNVITLDTAILASARLAVVGLEGGAQPCSLNSIDYLTYNGEIFNFPELNSRYVGNLFELRPDTENLFHFIDKLEISDFKNLEGQFAFAFWKSNLGELLLARDRFGEKPLYYSKREEYIVFSSCSEAIANFEGLHGEFDSLSISSYLERGYLESNRSIFKNISQVKPGECITWKNNILSIQDFKAEKNQNYARAPQEDNYVERLDEIFNQTVSKQLLADVDVGIFLSGGLDSSLIAYYAKQFSSGLKTFSIEIPDQSDDASRSNKLAKILQLEHHQIVFNREEFDIALRNYVELFDIPLADSGLLPLLSLVRHAKQELKVALSGEGGDELFAGYPWSYLQFDNMEKRKELDFFANIGLRVLRKIVTDDEQKEKITLQIIANTNRLKTPTRRYLDFISKDNFLSIDEIGEIGFAVRNRESFTPRSFVLQDALKWDQQNYLINNLLVKADRSSMALGFEIRLPFLADSMVRFAHNLPNKLLIDSNRTKVLLRQLASSLMPRMDWDGKKYGLGIPSVNLNEFMDLEKELDKLLSSRKIKQALLDINHELFKKSLCKNRRTMWMGFMLLKWMEFRV